MLPEPLEPSDEELRALESEQGFAPLDLAELALSKDMPVPLSELSDLDDALAQALDARRSAVPSKARQREKPAGLMRLDSLYKDPANWCAVRNVQLLHKGVGADTLLGNFIEFKHLSIRSARKLTQAAYEPSLPQGMEWVTDPWYIETRAPRLRHEARKLLSFPMTMVCRLEGLVSAETPILVKAVRDEGISRVELAGETQFFSLDRKTIVFFPQGLDILGGLATECKVAIRIRFDGECARG